MAFYTIRTRVLQRCSVRCTEAYVSQPLVVKSANLSQM